MQSTLNYEIQIRNEPIYKTLNDQRELKERVSLSLLNVLFHLSTSDCDCELEENEANEQYGTEEQLFIWITVFEMDGCKEITAEEGS